MKNKRGFTLIELLAVIVILAIIALIATPMVLKYIEQSKEESFKSSIKAIEKAAELKVLELENDKVTYPVEIDIQDLDIKNKENLEGKITISKDNSNKYTYEYEITNGDYNFIDDKIYKVDKSVKLKFKTENGVVDETNKYVYSFYSEDMDNREGYAELNLGNYITAENGTVEFIENDQKVYSTGAKIVLKDKKGNKTKEYTVIIFGDVNGEGYIDSTDCSVIDAYIYDKDKYPLNKYQLFASDVNHDGQVNEEDFRIVESHDGWGCFYNNITYECTPYE